MSNQYHVTYSEEKDKWQIIKDNGKKSIQDFDTQKQAKEKAVDICKNQEAELIVHRKDNSRFREKNSYGNDPSNIEG